MKLKYIALLFLLFKLFQLNGQIAKEMERINADLDNSEDIKPEHLAEAIQYRSMDREAWGG